MNSHEILYGFVLTLIISIIMGFLLKGPGAFIGIFISTLIMGFRVSCDVVEGAIYGTLIAVLTGTIFIGAMIFMTDYPGGLGYIMMNMGFTTIILSLVVLGLIGSIGGLSGSYIRHWRLRCDFRA